MFRWFHDRFGDLAEPSNLDRCLNVMLRYQRLSCLRPDRAQIEAAFAVGPPTYGHLFDVMHSQEAARRGKPRWGDKSLHHEHHAEAIFTEWPDASIIHLIRDPRDRHASVTSRYPDRRKHIASVTGRWVQSMRTGSRNLRRYPDRYMMLRYEDLVHETVPSLQRVCELIGEPYDPGMLAMNGAMDRDTEGNSSFETVAPGTISTRSIGRFRNLLAAEDVRFIETFAGRIMRANSYQLDTPAVASPASYLLGSLPVDGVRMAAWMLGASMTRRRGEQIPAARLATEPVS
jgi:hypothetical protein